ncbi:hypothetical protein RCL1_004324 [Eukaryota sp. TZLM3-RCL]
MILAPLFEVQAHQDRVWSLAFSPDSTHLLSCSGDCSINLYSFDSQLFLLKPLKTFQNHARAVRRVAWRSDSRAFVSSSFDKSICVYTCTSNDDYSMERIEGHECEVKAARFSDQGLLASCSRDRLVWVWEFDEFAEDYEVTSVLHGHDQDVKNLAWHPSGNIIASCSYDATIRIWKNEGGLFVADVVLSDHTDTVWSVVFSKNGEFLYSTGADGRLLVYRFECNEVKLVCDFNLGTKHCVYELSVHPLLPLLAVACGDHSIIIVKISNPFEPVIVERHQSAHQSDVNSVSWHSELPVLASGDDIGIIKVWSFNYWLFFYLDGI